MKKLTEDLKKRATKNKKVQVYCFLIEANRIAFENGYRNFGVDTGVKTIESFINNKIDVIFDEKTGAYWNDKFRGFDEIYEKAKAAASYITNDSYSIEVINFINAAIKSYVPKIDENKLRGQYSVLPVKVTEEENIKFLEQGVTGVKLKKMREDEKAYQEGLIKEEEDRKGILGMMEGLEDDEEEEIEEEETEFSEEEKNNILGKLDEL